MPASPNRKAAKTPEPESSPISRAEVSGQMQDIFSMVKALRDEKDGLIAQLEQMELRNEVDNKRFCKEISKCTRDIDGLQEIFVQAADGVNAKSAYGIPEVPEAAVAALIPETLHGVMKGEAALDWAQSSPTFQNRLTALSLPSMLAPRITKSSLRLARIWCGMLSAST